MRLSDTWLALIFIAIAVMIFGFTTTFPPFPGQKYGPALFPRILSVGIVFCSVAMMYRGWQRHKADAPRPAVVLDPAFRQPGLLISFLLIPGAIVLYLLLADLLGFIPTAFILLLGLMLWFRAPLVWAVVVAVAVTGLMQWFFGTLMRVPLPRGLFMQILYGG